MIGEGADNTCRGVHLHLHICNGQGNGQRQCPLVRYNTARLFTFNFSYAFETCELLSIEHLVPELMSWPSQNPWGRSAGECSWFPFHARCPSGAFAGKTGIAWIE